MGQMKNHNGEDQPVLIKSCVNVLCVCACAVQIVFWLVWVCLNLLAGAMTCLWLNIHVPSGHAQVCSCLTSVSICSNMLAFVLLSVFCLYLPNTQTLFIHAYMPTDCCTSIKAWRYIWPLRPLRQFHHLKTMNVMQLTGAIFFICDVTFKISKYQCQYFVKYCPPTGLKIQSGLYIDIVRD